MLEVFEKLVAESEKKANFSQEDYLVEGLLHCGKCGTPKQIRIQAFGEIQMPYIPCACEEERYRREEEELENLKKSQKIAKIRSECFIDKRLTAWTFSNDDHAGNPAVMNSVYQYARHFQEMLQNGKGLLLYGTQGVGKSYAAACVANAVIDQGYSCVMTNFPRIINIISGMYQGKQEYIDELCRHDLLIIDDLSAERSTDYADEIVMNVIDTRCTFGLPLIVTTNLTADEMKHAGSISKKRIYSRLFEMTIPLEYTGDDRRKYTMLANYERYKELLNLPD